MTAALLILVAGLAGTYPLARMLSCRQPSAPPGRTFRAVVIEDHHHRDVAILREWALSPLDPPVKTTLNARGSGVAQFTPTKAGVRYMRPRRTWGARRHNAMYTTTWRSKS